jgi:predicted RND superfamily exporter protein
MADLTTLRKRRWLTLAAFGLVTVFIFSGFVIGPSGNNRPAFSLEGNPTWDAADLANEVMPAEFHPVPLFIGPAWQEEGGNVLALPVLRELVSRHDEVMAEPEISEHFVSRYHWMVQTEVSGTWGIAETVRMVMDGESTVSEQIGWNGSDFDSASQVDLDDLLSRLFSIQMPDGSKPYADFVSGLEQDEDGVWHGSAYFIFGLADSSTLYGPDGEYSKVSGDVKPFFEEWELIIDEIYAEPMDETGEPVHVWTYLAIDSEINEEVNQTMPLIGVSFLLMVLIIGLFFRDWRDILAASAGLGMLMGWMFGTQAWLGYPQTQVSSMLPILLLALGVDFSFHGLNRWRAIAHREGGGEEARLGAAWTSIRELWPALGLATVTTMIAFGTAAFSPIPDLAEWGRLAAIFIPQAYLLLGIFTVVLRSGNAVKSAETQKKFADWMRSLGSIQVRKPIIFSLILLILTGSALAIGQPDTDFDVHDYLDGDSRTIRSLDITKVAFDVDQRGEPGFILVEPIEDGDLAEHSTLVDLDSLMAEIQTRNWTYDDATVIDMIRWQVRLVESGGPGFNPFSVDAESGLPTESVEIQAVLLDISRNGTRDLSDPTNWATSGQVREVALIDGSGVLKLLKLPIKVELAEDWVWMAEYKVEVDGVIGDHISKDSGVTATLTGPSYQRFVYVNAMTDSFQNSIYIAIVACFAVLLMVFRNIRLSLLTIAPVVAVSLWLYAGMELVGASLNIVTLQVASLAIGLGLDYAIHVTQAIREQRKRRPDAGMGRWVQGMMGHTGTALFASGLTDIIGFSVLLLSVMPMFTMFGKVMIAMVLLAQAACVFILPALLTLFGGLEKEDSESDAPADSLAE